MKSIVTRNTKPQKTVQAILQNNHTPLSLAQLYVRAQEKLPAISYSTVFRIVLKLAEERKVVKVDWRERGSRYEWAERPHHHHIVCENCQTITDIPDSLLQYNDHAVSTTTGFVVKHHSIELQGICLTCQTNNYNHSKGQI